MHALRGDIQVLRAVAVLAVLAFHFDVPGLSRGYLGVDIFFVISGYLMSGVIVRGMDAGRFSAAEFYFRRAKRLLPAVVVTLTATTLVAPWVLTHSALMDYARQMLGTLTFTANLVLWSQTGYFDGAAELKPLLHTWSLALEEQYYFALPAALCWAGARWRSAMLWTLSAASLGACLVWQKHDPSGSFYLLPTRAWEMLLGSLCALPGADRWRDTVQRRFPLDTGPWLVGGMAVLLGWGVDPVHPRGDALLVCLCTAGLIVRPSPSLSGTSSAHRALHWVGDRSYSLYLVHWPLIALAKNVWLQGLPAQVAGALAGATVVLAHLNHAMVEERFRRATAVSAWAWQMRWLLLPLAVACGGLWLHLHAPQSTDGRAQTKPNLGLGAACEYEGHFSPQPSCQTQAHPRTVVWGDSYAMHLLPALQSSQIGSGGLMQITRSACTPSLRYARLGPQDPPARAAQCLSLSQEVLRHLAAAPWVSTVVIASRWQYLLDEIVVDAQGHRVHPNASDIADDMAELVTRLRRMHKKVVIVSPPALLGPQTNMGLCAERRQQGLWTVMSDLDMDCSFSEASFRQRQAPVLGLLSEIDHRAQVSVIDLSRFNCQHGRCQTIWEGQALYRDAGHLTVGGAQRLGAGLSLMAQVDQLAR